MSIKNVLSNALKPGYFKVMLDKVIKRLKEPQIEKNKLIATEWCKSVGVDTAKYLSEKDKSLYDESYHFNEELHQKSKPIIEALPFKMGAGGNCILIYFLTKYYKPRTILETGVSMGFSSKTFLTVIKEYGGSLYSSDFPYFRHANPEKYVGCIVPGELKSNWNLYIKGDRENFKEILPKLDTIDLFHFDSDKSYEGRAFAFQAVLPYLNQNSVVIFDDINDNLHFKDLVNKYAAEYFVLTSPNGGYVGLITKLKL